MKDIEDFDEKDPDSDKLKQIRGGLT